MALGAYIAVFVAFVLIPLVVVVGASFEPKEILRFPPHGFSWHWYHAVLQSSFVPAARISLVVGIIAMLGALVLGVPAAWALARHSFRGKAAMLGFLSSPLLVPELVIGVALLQIFVWLGLGSAVLTLSLGHIVITLPYVVRIIYAAVLGLDASVEEAASSLGANRLKVYATVVLPMIRPGLYSSILFAFLISFDNAVISLFLVTGATTTLPIAMYTYIQYDLDPSIAAVSTILMVLSIVVMVLASRFAPLDRLGS
ncbi:MAG: ABC transporter permease [Candidimonas sp.]|nr:MAG: ABC transporter permease [Candidimonas sp.]